jgi:glycosyltransferase involved in cell wall biosynthesis
MRIAFVGNQDNNAYRLCKWIRQRDIDAELYLFPRENPTRSRPEQVDPDLADGYPSWVRQYDDNVGLWPLKRGPVARRIDNEHQLVVTSGATGLLAAGYFKHTPVVHIALGSEVSQYPLWVWRWRLSLKWRAASFIMRRNLKRVAKIVTLGFRPELAALDALGCGDKAVVWGWPEDPQGNRRRVDRRLLAELTDAYAEFDRVFLWTARLNFMDPSAVDYKGADRFLDALEMLAADGKYKFKAIVGSHGYDVDVFKARAAEKGLDDHIDYTDHMPFHRMLTYMSIPNGVVVNVLDADRGHIFGGIVREAMSLGAPVISAADADTVIRCYGADCPIMRACDAQSCREAMVSVLEMDDQEFSALGLSAGRWADEHLHYDRRLDELLDVLGGVHG